MHTAPITPADRRPRPSVLATEPGRVLLVVTLVSLLVHGLIALASYDRPLGRVDPALFGQDVQPIRVKRAVFDQFVELSRSAGEAEDDEPATLAQLSDALLQETPPPAAAEREFEPDLDLREVDQSLRPDWSSQLAIEMPGFELSEQVLAELTPQRPGELEYRGTDELGFGGGSSDAAGGAGVGGPGSEAARSMLRQSGLIAVRPPSEPMPRSGFDDAANLDQQLLEVPTQGPQIDFARLALADTTRLEVPEHLDQDFDYAVTRYTDLDDPARAGWFRVDITPRRSLHKLQTMPKDLVYVIDTSSSVPQDWIRQVVAGVQQSLRLLNDADRFNIVLFSDQPAFFSTTGAVPASVQNIDAGIRFLTDARSRGYTDVNAALSHVLIRDVQIDRVYEVVLITDGLPTRGVMDTRELINLITRDNDLATSIYCVGIGRRPNRELLNFLAYRNKGFSVFAQKRDEIAPTIRQLGSRLRYPLIKNLRVSVAGRQVREVYPLDLPNIHQGERFALFGRFDQPAPFTIRITGSSSGRNVDFSFTRDLAQAPRGDATIARDWAFWKLHHLYSELIRQGNQPALLDQIEHLRDRYNLKTLY